MNSRIIRSLAALTVCAGLLAGCGDGRSAPDSAATTAAATLSVVHVEPAAAGQLIETNSEVIVLDVRTPEEYADGHIAGATNVNFRAENFETELAKLDKTKPYLVHCASGGRSTKTLDVLKKLNFERAYHLDGGFNAWKEAGQPVEK